MATIITDLRSQVAGFFDYVTSTATDAALGSDLPLVGDALSTAVPAALPLFGSLQTVILDALDGLNEAASAATIAAALDGIDGVDASVSGDDILIHIGAADSFSPADQSFELDVGLPALGVAAAGSVAFELGATLDVNLSLDTLSETHALTTVGGSGDELALTIEGSLDVAGSGDLGFLGVAVADELTTPEIAFNAALDLAGGRVISALTAADVTTTIDGAANLRLELTTELPSDILPTLLTDLVVSYDIDAFDPTTGLAALGGVSTIALEDIRLDLGAFGDFLSGVFGPFINDVFGSFPLEDVLDVITTPLPIIDDALHALQIDRLFDRVGNDGIINLLDLAAFSGTVDQGTLDRFALAFNFIKAITETEDLGEIGTVDLGSVTLVGDPPAGGFGVFATPVFTPSSGNPLQDAIDGLDDELGNVDDPQEGLGAITAPLVDVLSTVGISIPLLTNPGSLVPLLLNGLGGGDEIELIKYDVPVLEYPGVFNKFFPILGPIGVGFGGEFRPKIDVDFGYDTKGIATGSFEDGFYFTTRKLPTPILVGGEMAYYAPAGTVSAGLNAYGGVSVGFAGAFVGGGLTSSLDAYFPNAASPEDDANGKLRLVDLGDGCWFDPITGRFGAEVFVKITIDFGLFAFTRKFDIADVTLADFNYGCAPSEDEPYGLATLGPASGVAADVLALNAGERAGSRAINGTTGTDVDERFHVRLAYDENGVRIAGALDVSAYALNEHFGTGADPATLIYARMGNERDTLVIASDVAVAADVEGGAGDDLLAGGLGNDRILGNADGDHLIGGGGADLLEGGDGDDLLEGGAGADTIDGGANTDQVSYEHSTAGVIFSYQLINGRAGFVGAGGEAEGDRLYSIEYIIGSHYADRIYGNPGNERNTIEGLDGADILVGGAAGDYLLGGGGADQLVGGGGVDATSYLTSSGQVIVNLGLNYGLFGDAAGDSFSSIENVQGSFGSDSLTGDAADNALDGWYGDDILAGGGGRDTVSGYAGADTIYGGADGDTLDGGGAVGSGERDLLTYASRLFSGVTINLLDGSGDDATVRALLPSGAASTGYSTFEDLTGSIFSDILTGDNGSNVIRGLAGDDSIAGAAGDDVVVGGAGADAMNGGAGRDLADYRGATGGVYVSLSFGLGLFAEASGDTLASIENLRGSDFVDTLDGDAADNDIDPGLARSAFFAEQVSGGGGDDILILDYSRGDTGLGLVGGYTYGFLADGSFQRLAADGATILDSVVFTDMDRLQVVGTIAADTIYGSQGADFIATNGGDDIVYTGLGFDRVFTGSGNDRLFAGTGYYRELSAVGGSTQMELVGGRGIDTLSISLAGYAGPVAISGTDGTSEFSGINLTLANGTGIREFELLGEVLTGRGDDSVTQPGVWNNSFSTGFGVDVIRPGLGIDNVSGGLDYRIGSELLEPTSTQLAPPGIVPEITQFPQQPARPILLNPGDLMVLDYSSVAAPVTSTTQAAETGYSVLLGWAYISEIGTGPNYVRIQSNNGTYMAGDNAVNFNNIERLQVDGSALNDLLTGTDLLLGRNYFRDENGAILASASLRGDDYLYGGAGDDVLVGKTGDDTLLGGIGNDVLFGSSIYSYYFDIDEGEIDYLVGGDGSDTFILGNEGVNSSYTDIASGNFNDWDEFASTPNRAVIADFDRSTDRIQLFSGSAVTSASYRIVESGGDSYIYQRDGLTAAEDELIAHVLGATGLDLNAGYFFYQSTVSDLLVPAVPITALELAGEGPSPPSAAADAPAAEADEPSWVTQTNDAAALKAALFGGSFSPLGQGTLTLDGNAAAFGTFSGDPFGLGSGVVLSTGEVEQLAGVNAEDGGLTLGQSFDLSFEAIAFFAQAGGFGGATVYRADLSNLGVDLNSILLGDQSQGFGGSGGFVSGFDIDALALSNTRLDGLANLADFNSAALLPRLDVLGLSSAETQFRPGTQRGETARDLAGSANGMVNFDWATLGTVDATGFNGTSVLSLGDGGSVGFDLRQSVSTDGPLYLYVVESGDVNAERLTSGLTASTNRLNTPTDLSTDLGLPGVEGDDVSLTYTFTPTDAGGNVDPSVTQIAFDFMFFSEELVEYAESEFNDQFKIMLNGVNLARLSDGSFASVNTLYTPLAGPGASSNIFELRADEGSSDFVYNPVGDGPTADQTRADGYSRILRFVAPINPGVENVLTIEARDVRDGLLDSGILVRGESISAETSIGFTIDRSDQPLQEGAQRTVNYGLVLPAATTPGGPIVITFDPTAGLDLGAGAGAAVTRTVAAGGPYSGSLLVAALADGTDLASHGETIAVAFGGAPIGPVAPVTVLVTDGPDDASGGIGGTSGDDVLPGTPGDDGISGGCGDDVILVGDGGTDHVDGGPGKDTVDYGSSDHGLVIVMDTPDVHQIVGRYGDLDPGVYDLPDGAYRGAPHDTLSSIEVVKATGYQDFVFGADARVEAYLGGGDDFFDNDGWKVADDRVYGHGGNDVIYSGAGRDSLVGGYGDDSLAGEAGDDWLYGARGDDWLDGGAGADVFRYKAPNEGDDRIGGFVPGEDRIDLAADVLVADVLASQELLANGNLVIHYAGLGIGGTATLLGVGAELTAAAFI